MQLIRSRLVAVALALLAWQITGVAVTPVALCSVNPARAGSGEGLECTCDHDSDGVCPMHKTAKKQTAGPRSHPTRLCEGCGDRADTIIETMLASGGGTTERRQEVVRPAARAERMFLGAAAWPDATRPPVSPPPKG
jgi:hypothetical protein